MPIHGLPPVTTQSTIGGALSVLADLLPNWNRFNVSTNEHRYAEFASGFIPHMDSAAFSKEASDLQPAASLITASPDRHS